MEFRQVPVLWSCWLTWITSCRNRCMTRSQKNRNRSSLSISIDELPLCLLNVWDIRICQSHIFFSDWFNSWNILSTLPKKLFLLRFGILWKFDTLLLVKSFISFLLWLTSWGFTIGSFQVTWSRSEVFLFPFRQLCLFVKLFICNLFALFLDKSSSTTVCCYVVHGEKDDE